MATPRAVLFDFSGTLFHIESARDAVLASLGERYLDYVPALERFGAINGSGTPEELPDDLADVWQRRDLSADAHRAAYSGAARHAGLSESEARRLYDRGIDAAAWSPYPDTISTLQTLRERSIRVALVSNIGWDPRPVLRAADAEQYFASLVLSDERGVMKPDPRIFREACADLGVDPADAVMVGDTAASDGGAVEVGIRFELVSSAPDRAPDTLMRAIASRGTV